MIIGETKTSDGAVHVKDGTDASFMADVVEASKAQPVIVDFWAPWCGPCRQLGPVIERLVNAEGGKVKLVKVNTEEHPHFAGQLRVQSIPAVFAFKDGKPVDAFLGNLPESQVKAFITKQFAAAPGEGAVDALLEHAQAAAEQGDVGGAAEAYAHVLQADPANHRAIAGLARCYLAGGEVDKAAAALRMAGAARDMDLDAANAAVKLAETAPKDGADFEQRVAADPADFVARVELARVRAAVGRYAEASDQLFAVVEKDRDWNGGMARRILLEVFDAAGPTSEVARAGRRRLSSILFS